MSAEFSATEPVAAPRWKPLEPLERRVLGVLVEKAKTTPENYPLSINGLKNGCNQKNNRAPLMQIEEDRLDDVLESLRKAGAIAAIQGSGRVEKYRHLAYDWLGVDKVELAVMAELLLRGTQTVGELRGRAARMEPIKDMGELRPVLDSLLAKGLIQFLTPEGRGAIVTHSLYQEREMEKVRREAAEISGGVELTSTPPTAAPARPTPPAGPVVRTSAVIAPAAAAPTTASAAVPALEPELARLREEITSLRGEFATVQVDFKATLAALRRELDELNRQLGN